MERFYAVCQDLGVVLNQHGGTGSPDYGPYPISLPIRLLETGFYSTRSYPHLLMSGVFERYPKLRYITTESGCAWVPGMLANLDRIWSRVQDGRGGRVRVPGRRDAARAAELLREAQLPLRRELAVAARARAGRHEIGIERILWGSDYPHYEGTFPNSRKAIRHSFHDKPEPEMRAILGENAAQLYDFELGKLQPWADQLGPKPAEIAVPLTTDEFPKNSHTGAFM